MFIYRDTSISQVNLGHQKARGMRGGTPTQRTSRWGQPVTMLGRLGTWALWEGFTVFAALVVYIFVFT
jgi:hypothetical protein